jgi:hypothetical protein
MDLLDIDGNYRGDDVDAAPSPALIARTVEAAKALHDPTHLQHAAVVARVAALEARIFGQVAAASSLQPQD